MLVAGFLLTQYTETDHFGFSSQWGPLVGNQRPCMVCPSVSATGDMKDPFTLIIEE